MMNLKYNSVKDAYKAFWMVKGHLNASEETILSCYEGYFRRIWHNEEGYLHNEGFEEAYKQRMEKLNESK